MGFGCLLRKWPGPARLLSSAVRPIWPPLSCQQHSTIVTVQSRPFCGRRGEGCRNPSCPSAQRSDQAAGDVAYQQLGYSIRSGEGIMDPKEEEKPWKSTGGGGGSGGGPPPPPPRPDCIKCFDALWFCYSPYYQMQNYYRYGEFDNCFAKWGDLVDCLTLKTKRAAEVEEILVAREKARPHIWTFRTVDEASDNWLRMYSHLVRTGGEQEGAHHLVTVVQPRPPPTFPGLAAAATAAVPRPPPFPGVAGADVPPPPPKSGGS